MFANFKIILFPKVNSDGTQTVMFRVTYRRKSRYFSLNRHPKPDQWDSDSCRFKKNYPDHKIENDILRTYEQRAADLLRTNERDNIEFTFDRFETEMFAGRSGSGQTNLVEYIRSVSKSLEDAGDYGNSVIYASMSNVVDAFRPKAVLSDVDERWLIKWEQYQRVERGSAGGGIRANMRTLRAVCNRAIKKDKIMPLAWYPFSTYSLAHLKGSGNKRAISLEDIRKLENAVDMDATEEYARDLFLFSFYTRGMNMADIAELSKGSVRDGRIRYTRKKGRKKTATTYSIAITDKASAIIEKYQRPNDSHLFPILTDSIHTTERLQNLRRQRVTKTTNYALRSLAMSLEIPTELLTFYSARHTYATALKKKGVSTEIISEALGHKDLRTTEIYLKSFEDSVIDAADGLLI